MACSGSHPYPCNKEGDGDKAGAAPELFKLGRRVEQQPREAVGISILGAV